jgi:hypothetical protein
MRNNKDKILVQYVRSNYNIAKKSSTNDNILYPSNNIIIYNSFGSSPCDSMVGNSPHDSMFGNFPYERLTEISPSDSLNEIPYCDSLNVIPYCKNVIGNSSRDSLNDTSPYENVIGNSSCDSMNGNSSGDSVAGSFSCDTEILRSFNNAKYCDFIESNRIKYNLINTKHNYKLEDIKMIVKYFNMRAEEFLKNIKSEYHLNSYYTDEQQIEYREKIKNEKNKLCEEFNSFCEGKYNIVSKMNIHYLYLSLNEI